MFTRRCKRVFGWLLRVMLVGSGLLLLVLATFGFWLDRVVQWQSDRWGLEVGEVRGGWGWVEVCEARWVIGENRYLTIDSLRAPTPFALLLAWSGWGEAPTLCGGSLLVHLAPARSRPAGSPPPDIVGILQEINTWAERLARWNVGLELGSLAFPASTHGGFLRWEKLRWADNKLTADWLPPPHLPAWLPSRLGLSLQTGASVMRVEAHDYADGRGQLLASTLGRGLPFVLRLERGAYRLMAQGRAPQASRLWLEQLHLTQGQSGLSLSAPWEVFAGPGRTGAASFSVDLELDSLLGERGGGSIGGRFGWEASAWLPWPALRGSLTAEEIRVNDLIIEAPAIRFGPEAGPALRGRVAARSIRLPAPNGEWAEIVPRLQFPAFSFHIDAGGLEVAGGQVEFRDGRILFEGAVPLPPQRWWGELGRDWLRWWEKCRLGLFLDEFELAAVPDLLPAIVRPTGYFMGKVQKKSGDRFPAGSLVVRDVSLRPLPNFGSIHDIGFQLVLDGPRLRLENGVGILGRRPVEVSGEIGLGPDLSYTDFRLTIAGSRLRLVRQPRFILYGDVALTMEGRGREPGRISGAIRPVRGMLFQSLPSLRPSPTDSQRRPPYFSVTEEPWRGWDLAVAIQGTEFLEIRNPFARLLLSADLGLEGTLEEPRAIGNITVDRSLISFPFVRFRSQEGRIEASRANPFDPEIAFSATGRLFGYDLLLEVSGSVSDPILSFSSTPFLESSEILKMISTGILPASAGDERQARFSTLGIYLGRTLLDSVRTDHLQFTEEPSLLERTEIEFGRELTQSGLDTINVEMPLSDRISILGEYDRFDTYNLSLRWRIFTR